MEPGGGVPRCIFPAKLRLQPNNLSLNLGFQRVLLMRLTGFGGAAVGPLKRSLRINSWHLTVI